MPRPPARRPFLTTFALSLIGCAPSQSEADTGGTEAAADASSGPSGGDSTTGDAADDDGSTDSGEPNGSTGNVGDDSGTGDPGDPGDPGDTGETDEPGSRPELTLCDPSADPIWSTTTGGRGHDVFVAYACTTACDSLEACAEADGPWTQVHFVVDQMAGSMRWQLGEDLVFMHNGGTGTSYPASGLIEPTLAGGHGVAMAYWQPGAHVDDTDLGWATRPDEEPTDLVRLTARVAAVIDWVHTNLSAGAFGTAACSAGAYVTMAAQLWHGLDERLDYQLLIGGPPFADLERGCGADLDPVGRCGNDPVTECTDADDCGPGPGSLCSPYHNDSEAPLADMVDSIHGTDPSCEQGQAAMVWDDSGFFTTDADWDLSHPVDFVMNMGPGFGDPQIGAFSNAWDVAQALSGETVGWHQQPGIHCGAFADDSTWPLLQAGMGW